MSEIPGATSPKQSRQLHILAWALRYLGLEVLGRGAYEVRGGL